MKRSAIRYIRVALSLAGSAILLFSCKDSGTEASEASEETMMTEYSENLAIVMSENGRRSYFFETPLLEGYTLAREPYREFRKGIRITTYQDDSLSTVDVVLTANYAINYENRKLWEAKGNVVARKSDGTTLYTQQLFWNARTGRIYSNVDTKIEQKGGREYSIGEGFESDESFKDWRFRKQKTRLEVDVTPGERGDSTVAARRRADSAKGDDAAGNARPSQVSGREGSASSGSRPLLWQRTGRAGSGPDTRGAAASAPERRATSRPERSDAEPKPLPNTVVETGFRSRGELLKSAATDSGPREPQVTADPSAGMSNPLPQEK